MSDDPLSVPYRERERSTTMERLGDQREAGDVDSPVYGTAVDTHDEVFTINIGPHHPATHGVLRLLCTLEGEMVRDMVPIIGYVHTGIEKSCEDQQYWKVIPFVERMDYLSYYFNATAFAMSVERLLDIEVPERAQALRVIHMELNRVASHLFWAATGLLDLFEYSSGQRMHPRYVQVGGVFEDIPPGWEQKCREFIARMPGRLDEYEALLARNEILLSRLKNTGF